MMMLLGRKARLVVQTAGVLVLLPVVGHAAPRDPGEVAYSKTCVDCHAPGRSKIPAARGAPRLGDRNGWESRVSKGLDGLYNKISNNPHGKQDRPHERLKTWRGELSDRQVRAALKFMLSKVE